MSRDQFLALQRSMLPSAVGRSSELLDVAARYAPGTADVEVGGDWYDVIPLSAGRTALVIGDVMGRGVHAAAVMGQSRAAVRAYAQLDLLPGRVLDLLDRMVEHVREARDVGQIVTCIYAVHDSADRTLTLASAGHPCVRPDRGAGLFPQRRGPSLPARGAQCSGCPSPLGVRVKQCRHVPAGWCCQYSYSLPAVGPSPCSGRSGAGEAPVAVDTIGLGRR